MIVDDQGYIPNKFIAATFGTAQQQYEKDNISNRALLRERLLQEPRGRYDKHNRSNDGDSKLSPKSPLLDCDVPDTHLRFERPVLIAEILADPVHTKLFCMSCRCEHPIEISGAPVQRRPGHSPVKQFARVMQPYQKRYRDRPR